MQNAAMSPAAHVQSCTAGQPAAQAAQPRLPPEKGSSESTSSSSASPPSVIIWYISFSFSPITLKPGGGVGRGDRAGRGRGRWVDQSLDGLGGQLSDRGITCAFGCCTSEWCATLAPRTLPPPTRHELVQPPLAQLLVLPPHL